MKVSLVVPWRPTLERRAVWDVLRHRYEILFPDWEIIESDSSGRWNKPTAVNRGVERAAGDVVVVADADCATTQAAMEEAVEVAKSGRWVVPHRRVWRMSPEDTQVCLRNIAKPELPKPRRVIRGPVTGIPGGGIFVIRREAFFEVGGMDPRFNGWGGEDSAFGLAADTILGPHRRLESPLWHFWHPPGARSRQPHHAANLELLRAYKAAHYDRAAMREAQGYGD